MTTNSSMDGVVLRPEPDIPVKAVKLVLRVMQLAKEPGEHPFVLIVHPDGRWQLKPPPKVEELGQ